MSFRPSFWISTSHSVLPLPKERRNAPFHSAVAGLRVFDK